MVNFKNKFLEANPYLAALIFVGFGVVLNLAGWSLGFFFLEERALAGLFPIAEAIPGKGTVGDIWSRIITYNLLVAGGLIVIANLISIRGWPLGFLPVVFHWFMFGLFWGTNSFGIARGEKAAPSLIKLISSLGFLEISAYTLIAVATAKISILSQDSLLTFRARKTGKISEIRLSKHRILLLVGALALILTAGLRESLKILS